MMWTIVYKRYVRLYYKLEKEMIINKPNKCHRNMIVVSGHVALQWKNNTYSQLKSFNILPLWSMKGVYLHRVNAITYNIVGTYLKCMEKKSRR